LDLKKTAAGDRADLIHPEPAAMLRDLAEILQDPLTGEGIAPLGSGFARRESGTPIPMTDGIPSLFAPNDASFKGDVTELVKSFYEETPFPNYDGFDSRASLVEKARKGVFAALLDEQLPEGALVLEAGCGTGQLSNFLGMSWRRRVIAGDMCLNSLRLAKRFADTYSIRNVGFLQFNLFRPPFRDASFDVVVSNGVLHHTGDCEGGFRALLAKLKPGGHIVIGLYNSLGRLPTLWKRSLFQTFGPSLYFLDHRLRDWGREPERVKAWFMDQYRHPHETRHSMSEVLGWFERYGVDFVNGIPHLDGTGFSSRASLFEPHPAGTPLSRKMSELNMLAGGGKDGGLFIMIGRKR
jgi:SAM-dependent methyltransferase